MKLLHDTEGVNARDKYFIVGGNPDGSGGGVITSRNTLDGAQTIQRRAIMQGYTQVRILTYDEMMKEE